MILGTGWAGYRVLHDIDRTQYNISVVAPRNYFLFTPLLASTTTGVLDFRSIAEPIRSPYGSDYEFFECSCTDINFDEKKITCEYPKRMKKFEMEYDTLIIAVGADNNTYNIKGVTPQTVYFLKELSDARAIRTKIIDIFEKASLPGIDPQERKKLLHFVVVGGGPTGIEFAGELSDFFWADLNHYYPNIAINEVRITILEASDTILSGFSKNLVDNAIRSIKKQGIDLRTGSLVKEVQKDRVILADGSYIDCGLIVWSTGVGPRTLVQNLKGIEKTEDGRIVVDEYLRVKGYEDSAYALGDCACIEDNPLPATAQVAQQQAKYLARALSAPKGTKTKQFVYRPLGRMTYIGSMSALLGSKFFNISGFLGFIAWRSVYLTRLGSLKNKLQVPFNWTRTLIWGRDVTKF